MITNSDHRPDATQIHRVSAENIRAVIDELSNSLNLLDELLEYEHKGLMLRQLVQAQKELNKACSSLGLAAIAAEQLEGN